MYVSRFGKPNLLYRNERGERFADVTQAAGVAEPVNSFPTWFFDYDNDGWLDLFVGGFDEAGADAVAALYLGTKRPGGTPRLYRNRRNGTFEDVTIAAKLDRVLLAMGANYGDLDNDGFFDIYVGNGAPDLNTLVPNRMFRNGDGRIFQDVTTSGGFGHLQKGHGVSFGDLDNDGDQDIYEVIGGWFTGDTYQNVLFRNPGHGNRWITLVLEGTRSNRMAIGARVKFQVATPSGTRFIHQVVSSGGSFGDSSFQLETGLGNATAIEAIEVKWPATRETQVFTNVGMNQIVAIREGEPTVKIVRRPSFLLGGEMVHADRGRYGGGSPEPRHESPCLRGSALNRLPPSPPLSRRQQFFELAQFRLIRMHASSAGEPLARFRRAAKRDQRHRAAHPCFGDRGVQPDCLLVVRERRLRPSRDTKRFSETQPGFRVVAIDLQCGGESVDGLLVAAIQIVEHAQADVRLHVIRMTPQYLLELARRARLVAGAVQRRCQPVTQRGIVRLELETFPKSGNGRPPVLRAKRLHAAALVEADAFDQIGLLLPQRIRKSRPDLAAPAQVRVRARPISERPIRHRQGIVDRRGAALDRECPLEPLDGLAVRLTRQRGSSRPECSSGRRGLQRERFQKQRLRGFQASLVEPRLRQPDERRHVVRPQFQDALECGGRLRLITFREVDVPEHVRPPHVVRRERFRVAITQLRFVPKLGGKKQSTQPRVGPGAVAGRSARILDDTSGGRELIADLLLNRRRQSRNIR